MSPTITMDELRELANAPEHAAKRITDLLDAIAAESDDEKQSWLCECFENVSVAHIDMPSVAKYCLQDTPASAVWACKIVGRDATSASEYQELLSRALSDHPDLAVRQQAAFSLRSAQPLSEIAKAALTKAAQESDPRLKRLATKALEAAA